MAMTIPDRLWKWVALGLAAILLYLMVWPRLQAGTEALAYLNQCIAAGVCPTPDQLAKVVASKAPPAQPSPSPAPKGQ
jgi:hypothetical protein